MFRTIILGAAVTVSATVALAPAEASAQSRYRDGYYGRYDGYRYDRGYRDGYRYRDSYRSRYYRPRSSINVYLGGYPSYGYGPTYVGPPVSLDFSYHEYDRGGRGWYGHHGRRWH